MTKIVHIIVLKGSDYMNFFDGFLVNTVFILFPLLVYLIYVAYRNNIDKDYNDIVFQLALFTSLYLVMRHGYQGPNSYIVLLINIPLLFAFLNHKTFISIIISIVLIVFCIITMSYNFYMVFFEYTLYFLVYLYGRKNKKNDYYYINSFTIMKSFAFSFVTFYFISPDNFITSNLKDIFISIIVFYLAANIYYILIKKGEEIMNLNSVIKDLEREKTLQKSLFKITHEIKNPIAVCKGYLDMLDLNNQKKIKKYIPIVKGEIARTLTLMDDFLDYSRIKINKDVLDINLLIEDTYNSMDPLFKENKVVTCFNIMDSEIYIMGDYNRLKQVLINIFKNSFESRKKGAKLKLFLDTNVMDDSINIIIRDNGCGMSREQLSRVGEAFFTTKNKGTGLGICLSKEIISQHNGKIKYESKLNEGTRVTITLPVYNLT